MEQNDIDVLLSIKKSIELLKSCIFGIHYQRENIENVNCSAKIEDIVNTYSDYFNDVYVMQMTNSIDSLIKNINSTLTKECEHEIEEDYIDICPEKSVKIHYCKKCLLSM